jgi:hypothetical protein
MLVKVSLGLPSAFKPALARLGEGAYSDEEMERSHAKMVRGISPEVRKVGDHYHFHTVWGRKAAS